VLVFTFTVILHLTSLKSCVNKLDLQSSVILLLPFTRFLTQFIFQRYFCDCPVLVASICTNNFLSVQYETFSSIWIQLSTKSIQVSITRQSTETLRSRSWVLKYPSGNRKWTRRWIKLAFEPNSELSKYHSATVEDHSHGISWRFLFVNGLLRISP
jgi:hypothetical protein